MKQLIKPKVLRINRAKWRTGDDSKYATGKGHTQLLNEDGYMCCLGFFCNQSGIPKKLLEDINTPDGIMGRPEVPVLMKNNVETKVCSTAININDNDDMKPREREKKLRSLFKKSGVKVIITGKYKKNPIADA